MQPLDPIIVAQLDALMTDETNPITVLSNASALLYDAMADLNWAGTYIYSARTGTLDLGPFQGNVACTHIQPGSGVVGTAYDKQAIIVVPDVHAFAGHIACDAASNAEIVLPLSQNDQVFAIFDIDSPVLNRFSANDREVLAAFAATLAKHLDVTALNAIY